jgi:hypothetical protein
LHYQCASDIRGEGGVAKMQDRKSSFNNNHLKYLHGDTIETEITSFKLAWEAVLVHGCLAPVWIIKRN